MKKSTYLIIIVVLLLISLVVVKLNHKDYHLEANKLLQDLINSLGNATFIRAANSVPSKSK